MTPHNNVRAYRPRQIMRANVKPEINARRASLPSPNQCKLLALMAAAALMISLGLMQYLQVRIVELRARIDQLQASNIAISRENTRIEAIGAQVASRTQVVALAKKKLKLFEPDHGQVHRM
jgi:hypothetical protein